MRKQILYLFGEPGTGKITVARILQQRLGWRLFWLHDLDPVCAIVGRYPLPRLMDQLSLTILEEIMHEGRGIIYVRPSRDSESIERVLCLAGEMEYRTHLVRLWAEPETLVKRVSSRPKSGFRISNQAELHRYLNARPETNKDVPASWVFTGGAKTPEQVADEIQHDILEEEKSCERYNRFASPAK